jgi:RNA polymerase sigma-70 factor (ECF subfamily)
MRSPATDETGEPPPRPVPDIAPPDRLTVAYLAERETLRAFAARRTGSDAAAEEIVQEVWVRIARRMADGGCPERPEAFLQTVTANLTLDWLRRRRFRGGLAAPWVDAESRADPEPSAERALHGRRALEYLRTLIEALPPGRKAAFLAYRGEGLSLKAAARQLGVSQKTVHAQAAKAVEQLRVQMTAAGFWP